MVRRLKNIFEKKPRPLLAYGTVYYLVKLAVNVTKIVNYQQLLCSGVQLRWNAYSRTPQGMDRTGQDTDFY